MFSMPGWRLASRACIKSICACPILAGKSGNQDRGRRADQPCPDPVARPRQYARCCAELISTLPMRWHGEQPDDCSAVPEASEPRPPGSGPEFRRISLKFDPIVIQPPLPNPADSIPYNCAMRNIKTQPDLERLQGSWAVTGLLMDGTEMPPAMFSDARITVKGSRFTGTGMGAVYEGSVELDASNSWAHRHEIRCRPGARKY